MSIRQIVILALTGIGLTAAACNGQSASTGATGERDKVIATVGKTKITEGELAFLAEIGPPRLKAQLQEEQGRQRVIEEIINRELLYEEAVKRGLHRDAKVMSQIDMSKRVLIANAALQAIADEAARKYYDEHPEEYRTVELQHILVTFNGDADKKNEKDGKARDEKAAVELANELRADIEGGKAFAELAKEYSDDPATRLHGGSLGRVSLREPRLVRRGYEALLEKAFTLEPGTVAGPIKTTDGYHLIMISEPPSTRPFDEVASGIAFRMRNQVREDFVKSLRQQAKIVYAEPNVRPSSETSTPPEPEHEHK